MLAPRREHRIIRLRAADATQIGSLLQVRGIVTRFVSLSISFVVVVFFSQFLICSSFGKFSASNVQPRIEVVTYLCDTCGFESYQSVQSGDRFNPLRQCPSSVCQANRVKGTLTMMIRGSRFVPYQELRLQEVSSEVPVGSVPRSITVRCYGSLSGQCKPGDAITLCGVLLPLASQRAASMAAMGGFVTESYFEAQCFMHEKAIAATLDESEMKRIDQSVSELQQDPREFFSL